MIFGWHNAHMRCGWRIKRNSCNSYRNLTMGIFSHIKKPMNFFMSYYRRKCRDSNPDTAFAMDVLAGHWDTITPHLPGAVHRIRTCRSFPTNCFQGSLTSPDIRHILVRPTGLEPALAKANCPLKTACLPNSTRDAYFVLKLEAGGFKPPCHLPYRSGIASVLPYNLLPKAISRSYLINAI